jgi:hypothetical protein
MPRDTYYRQAFQRFSLVVGNLRDHHFMAGKLSEVTTTPVIPSLGKQYAHVGLDSVSQSRSHLDKKQTHSHVHLPLTCHRLAISHPVSNAKRSTTPLCPRFMQHNNRAYFPLVSVLSSDSKLSLGKPPSPKHAFLLRLLHTQCHAPATDNCIQCSSFSILTIRTTLKN